MLSTILVFFPSRITHGLLPSKPSITALPPSLDARQAIRNLYRLATFTGDIDALPLLNWFIDEQIEDESAVSAIIGCIRLIGEDGNGLLRLDEELSNRLNNT